MYGGQRRYINPGTADDEMSLYSAVVVVVVVVVGGVQGRMVHSLTATRQDLKTDPIRFPRNVYLLHTSTRRNIPEDLNLHQHRCENLESRGKNAIPLGTWIGRSAQVNGCTVRGSNPERSRRFSSALKTPDRGPATLPLNAYRGSPLTAEAIAACG